MDAPIRADLMVTDERDHSSHRYSRVARLRDPVTHAPLDYPPLYDVTLVCVAGDYLTLTGVELLRSEIARSHTASPGS